MVIIINDKPLKTDVNAGAILKLLKGSLFLWTHMLSFSSFVTNAECGGTKVFHHRTC